ncbi:MAG: hypothetical protein JW751_17190 [Polyangiaceae bacterium]|nr:hypothetical protein [Polyangiaceae bacterium]
MTKPAVDRIRDRIEAFIAEVMALMVDAKQARAVKTPSRAAVRAAEAPRRTRAAAQPTRKDTGATPGGKRSGGELDLVQESLLEVIELNPGQRMEELGRLMRMPTKELTLPMKKLLADRRVRTTGQKRATAYFAR